GPAGAGSAGRGGRPPRGTSGRDPAAWRLERARTLTGGPADTSRTPGHDGGAAPTDRVDVRHPAEPLARGKRRASRSENPAKAGRVARTGGLVGSPNVTRTSDRRRRRTNRSGASGHRTSNTSRGRAVCRTPGRTHRTAGSG